MKYRDNYDKAKAKLAKQVKKLSGGCFELIDLKFEPKMWVMKANKFPEPTIEES